MSHIKIKNYDFFIARIMQLLFSVFASYVILVLIALIADKKFISPVEFIEHVLLFDAKPIGLVLGWGAIIFISTALIVRSTGEKIKSTLTLKAWIVLKSWFLSLSKDYG